MLLILSEPMHFLPTHLQDLNSALTNSSFESDSAVMVVVVGAEITSALQPGIGGVTVSCQRQGGAIHLLCGFTDI